MSASQRSELRAEPNLTPLLDVVFQLITFFMLVINFSRDNFDARVKLPIAGSARPQDDADKLNEERFVLNIDSEGHVLNLGKPLSDGEADDMIRVASQLLKANLKALKGEVDPAAGLPGRVVIRADRDTNFTHLFALITKCQSYGYQKFDLKAMNGQ